MRREIEEGLVVGAVKEVGWAIGAAHSVAQDLAKAWSKIIARGSVIEPPTPGVDELLFIPAPS
jgi:uncharacterized protein with LGFP repeats